MNRIFSNLILGAFLIVAFASGLLLEDKLDLLSKENNGSGFVISNTTARDFDMSLFWEVYNILKKDYYKPEKVDPKKSLYGAIQGMARSLEDPYTEFLEPSLSKRFYDDISGEFSGIGVEIGVRKGILTVVAPLEGTPAQMAGLKSGDKILKIDDKETQDMTLEGAVSLIRGKEGTNVRLLIFRDEFKEAKEFNIVRQKIKIPVYNLSQPRERIYYLKLFNFNENSAREFSKAGREIASRSKLDGLILDLRNNPGGLLEASVEIAGWFLEKGKIVTKEVKSDKILKSFYSPGPGSLSKIKKIAVLINEGTASAAEILAGALKDHLGVYIIGQKSFGKGSIQTLQALRDGSSLKYTIAEWSRPSGEIINGRGITPDLEIKDIQDNNADEIYQEALKFLMNEDL